MAKLTERDNAILQHIAQFQLTTFEVLHRVFFEGKKTNAVKSTIRRLDKNKWGMIKSEKIPNSKSVYYRLTKLGAQTIGMKRFDCKRLGNQCLPRRYAVLHFICKPDFEGRIVLCRQETTPELFPPSGQRLMAVDFYIRETSQQEAAKTQFKVGFAVTDYKSSQSRLFERINSQLGRLIDSGRYSQLIAAGKFELTILTGNEGRKRQIDLATPRSVCKSHRQRLVKILPDLLSSFPIHVRTEVIPGLFDTIPGKKNRRNSSN